MLEQIKVLVTGGTFDKEYNEINGSLFFKDTHLQEMLSLGRCRLNLDISTLMMIDSLDMTPKHIDIIIQNIQECTQKRILITHGTDRMVEIAQKISSQVNKKTIVMTGAIIPYKFGSSDGLFNLGSALAFVQTLPNGVYIAMNGRYFDCYNCIKNKETGEFVTTLRE